MKYTVMALTMLIAGSLRADWCQWEDQPPSGYQFVCYPEYEQVMTQMPNWSLYNVGDIVWVRNSLNEPNSPETPTADRWYVFECPDNWCYNQSAGSSPSSEVPHGGYMVRENGTITPVSCYPLFGYGSLQTIPSDGSYVTRTLTRCANNLEIESCTRTVSGGDAAQHPEVLPCQ